MKGCQLVEGLRVVAKAAHRMVMDDSQEDVINSETLELMMRKIYGVMRGCSEVLQESD